MTLLASLPDGDLLIAAMPLLPVAYVVIDFVRYLWRSRAVNGER